MKKKIVIFGRINSNSKTLIFPELPDQCDNMSDILGLLTEVLFLYQKCIQEQEDQHQREKRHRNGFKQPRGHCSNECSPIRDCSLLTMEREESVSNEPRNETIWEKQKQLEEVSRRDAGHFYQLRGKQIPDLLGKRFLFFHTNTCPSITEQPTWEIRFQPPRALSMVFNGCLDNRKQLICQEKFKTSSFPFLSLSSHIKTSFQGF